MASITLTLSLDGHRLLQAEDRTGPDLPFPGVGLHLESDATGTTVYFDDSSWRACDAPPTSTAYRGMQSLRKQSPRNTM